jgi:hypothetical protein
VEIGDENPPSEIQVVEISSEIDNNNRLQSGSYELKHHHNNITEENLLKE